MDGTLTSDVFHLISDNDDVEEVEPVIPADDEEIILPEDPMVPPIVPPIKKVGDTDDGEELTNPDDLEAEELEEEELE